MQCESVICSRSRKSNRGSENSPCQINSVSLKSSHVYFAFVCVFVCGWHIYRFISISFSILSSFFLLRPYVSLTIFAFFFEMLFNFHNTIDSDFPMLKYRICVQSKCESSSINFPVAFFSNRSRFFCLLFLFSLFLF